MINKLEWELNAERCGRIQAEELSNAQKFQIKSAIVERFRAFIPVY